MANHFSDIGFKVEDKGDIISYAQQAFEKGERIEAENGSYIKWGAKSGEELWCSLNEKGEFLNVSPSFAGHSLRKVKIERSILPYKEMLEGSLYAWSEPISEKDQRYPFVFDVPNYFTLPKHTFPKISKIQLSAFANELSCFDNEKEFYSEKSQVQAKLALESFIPSGLFLPGGGKRDIEIAEGIFTGKVLEWKKIVNEFTGNPFVWILAGTLGGEVDVVSDPSLLTKEPVVGGYIMGSFWLTGRVLD